jgi:hypothetical protein
MMPFGILMDIGYVGSVSRHLVNPLPVNEPSWGSAWQPQFQDPTKLPTYDGNTTLKVDSTRPYVGYAGITEYTMGGTASYNALQVSANRRGGRYFTFGASYTWSKALGTASQLYLTSSPTNHPTNARADYGPLTFDRTQVVTMNFIVHLPSPAKQGGFLDNPVTRVALNGWELSGIGGFSSGAPTNITYSMQNVGSTALARQITGVETQGPRVRFTCEPNLKPGDRSEFAFINTACFAPALKGSRADDSGKNYIRGPGTNNWDVSLFKNIKFSGEQRYIQLRLESYNTFNHTQWNTINTAATFNAANKITNLPSGLGGTGGRYGFGAVNAQRSAGSGGPRVLQIAAKIYF